MTKQPKVPQLLVEKLALGELSKEQEKQVLKWLENEPGGLDRLEQIKMSDQEILEDYPPRIVVAGISSKMNKSAKPSAIFGLHPAMGVAMALIIALMVWALWPIIIGAPANKDMEGIILKGDPQLIIYQKEGNEARQLQNGDSVKSGDVLQMTYVAAGAKYGVIFSVDGRGEATLHFPKTIDDSAELESGGVVPLPYSYELDDAPKFERFFFVTSKTPLDVAGVMAKARALEINSDSIPTFESGTNVVRMILTKDTVE